MTGAYILLPSLYLKTLPSWNSIATLEVQKLPWRQRIRPSHLTRFLKYNKDYVQEEKTDFSTKVSLSSLLDISNSTIASANWSHD